MLIHSFTNDYSEGCHPLILQALSASNSEQHIGYGEDIFTQQATHALRMLIEDQDADVHLIAGGTLANLLVLSSMLKPFESVIATQMGHINTHETGAIEATGHKIETVPTEDGKLTPDLIKPLLEKFPLYHTVRPRVVYISNTTEVGAVYLKKELQELSDFCRNNDLLLYMDGARLASAIMSNINDLTMKDIAQLTDVFYLGGTKCGALFGEAVIITNDLLKEDFKYHQKQRGAMLAKGRALGIQFDVLLHDGLIFELASHANRMAQMIVSAFQEKGFDRYLTPPVSNQIFPVLPLTVITQLEKKYGFYIWQYFENDWAAIRLVTSWATPLEMVECFISDIRSL